MVQLEIARETDFGVNDQTYIVNTHLGEFINYNDTILGYDIDQLNMQELEDYENDVKKSRHQLPDIVVVKKTYPRLAKRDR